MAITLRQGTPRCGCHAALTSIDIRYRSVPAFLNHCSMYMYLEYMSVSHLLLANWTRLRTHEPSSAVFYSTVSPLLYSVPVRGSFLDSKLARRFGTLICGCGVGPIMPLTLADQSLIQRQQRKWIAGSQSPTDRKPPKYFAYHPNRELWDRLYSRQMHEYMHRQYFSAAITGYHEHNGPNKLHPATYPHPTQDLH